MDRIIWSFVACNTIFSVGHHIDHSLRHKIGWPLNHEVTPFTFALGVYVAVVGGALLSRRGVVGPGYWAILSGIGVAFVGGTHYGPFADDPPSAFAAAYRSQTSATFATVWLWLFLLSLIAATLYCAWRWAILHQRTGVASAAH
jgi:hypothetical protein